MNKHQLKCSCIHCHTETTTQSLSAHIRKCTSEPKNKCICCGKPTNNDLFCSNSCKAKTRNTEREKKVKPPKPDRTMERFLAGEVKERPTLRRMLTKTRGYKCDCCGLSDWMDKPITLIVDHIDGNAGDNRPENLRLICPNCNSQTDTFSGRNKGNGRKARGLHLN